MGGKYEIEYNFMHPHGRLVFYEDEVDMKKKPTEQEKANAVYEKRAREEAAKMRMIVEALRETHFDITTSVALAPAIYKELNRK